MLQLNVICMVLQFYQLPSCRLNWLNFLGHGESDLHLQCKSKSHCPWTNLKMTCTSYILGRSAVFSACVAMWQCAVADLTMDARWSSNVLQETFSENLCFGCIHLLHIYIYICIYIFIYIHLYTHIYLYIHISIVQLSSLSSYFVIFSFGLPIRFCLAPKSQSMQRLFCTMQREQPVSMQLTHVACLTNHDFPVCLCATVPFQRHIWIWHLRCGLAVGSWNFQSHRKGLQNPFLCGYLKDKLRKLERRKRHPDRLAGTLSCSRRWCMAWTCNNSSLCNMMQHHTVKGQDWKSQKIPRRSLSSSPWMTTKECKCQMLWRPTPFRRTLVARGYEPFGYFFHMLANWFWQQQQ